MTTDTSFLAPDLKKGLDDLGLSLSSVQQDQLLRYLDLVVRWSRVYNLTAIREPSAMLTQHLLDCLAIVPPLRRELGGAPQRVLDVGSGAGLPGVVLSICEPGWEIVCVDAVVKKTTFIRQVAAELGLAHLSATHQRVEAMAGPGFDLITSRAFATLADFVELTRARLAEGGRWAAMKANLADEELGAVPPDVSMFHVEPLKVPGLDAARCLVWMRPKAE